MTTALAIREDQTTFDEQQLAALRALGVSNAPAGDIALFFHQAARTGLDPFARQIYLINRGGKNTIQVGIDGFRVIRDRKGTYQGHTEEWCGTDGVWRDVWLEQAPPAAARVSVYVKGYLKPIVGIALWTEYAQIGSNGKPQALWGSKPALMLAKCAEALALRKAYPQDLSGLYTDDEIPEGGGTTLVASTPPVQAPFEAAPWEDRLAYAGTSNELHKLWLDAGRAGVLDEALTDGQPFRDAILAKKARIEAAADVAPDPAPKPDPAGYDYPPTDDVTPF